MILLKRAQRRDCRLVYEWRNHPKVRTYFFEPREISYDTHKEWFEKTLTEDDRFLFIAYEGDCALGVIRFDFMMNEQMAAEIDIYVAPELQGKGFGKQILIEGENWVKRNSRIQKLIARVKDENHASIKLFKGCGFKSEFIQFKKEIIRS